MRSNCRLLKIVDDNNIDLYSIPMNGELKGLCVDDNIFIKKDIDSSTELKCILAEEIGHYFTSYGNILDLKDIRSKKQELRAMGWAYDELIKLDDLVQASKQGFRSAFELADFLDVTEQFLNEAIAFYKSKYGIYKVIDNYIIYFEPFGVMKMF